VETDDYLKALQSAWRYVAVWIYLWRGGCCFLSFFLSVPFYPFVRVYRIILLPYLFYVSQCILRTRCSLCISRRFSVKLGMDILSLEVVIRSFKNSLLYISVKANITTEVGRRKDQYTSLLKLT